ncbi:hypothetical protein PHMEG_00013961 [Phytophthora megakarya]|uniref:Uncharacterized protein n=1 Tax=Phytophthora megakarya TaxID=4795 RepID=A0A225W6I8_9STRA|nr:hypothetical protein PHMEG_00013961 [Phytophthora megakarya]
MEKEYGPDFIQPSFLEVTAMDLAARTGKLEVLTWLNSHNGVYSCTTKAMDLAAEYGHLEIVQWLHTQRQDGCSTDAMDKAAGNGHLEVVKWLHENRREGSTTKAMDLAARNGHIDVVRWLYHNRCEGCSSDAFNISVEDSLDVLLFLVEKFPSKFDLSTMYRAARHAVRNGDVRTLQSLPSYKLLGLLGRPLYFSHVLAMACDDGHVHVVEWLLRLAQDIGYETVLPPCDTVKITYRAVEMDIPNVLKISIMVRHVSMIRWLWMHECKMDWSAYLRLAAIQNEYAVLRWLLDHSPQLPFCVAWYIFWEADHAEVVWWFSEELIVAIMCKCLSLNWSARKSVRWVLENISFDEVGSQREIRAAILQYDMFRVG